MDRLARKQDALVVLVRHGQSTANVGSVLSSNIHTNPLTEKGREQAKEIGRMLRAFNIKPDDKVRSSRLLRSRQTARIISGELGLGMEIVQDERLNERSFGKLEGKEANEYRWRFQKDMEVESFESLALRMNSFISQVEHGVVVAVSHGDTMRSPVLKLLGLDEISGFGVRAYNTNLAIIHVKNGEQKLIAFGMPIVNDALLQKVPAQFLA